MKAIKIDIEKKFVDIDGLPRSYEVAKYPGIGRMVQEGEISDQTIDLEKITYERVDVMHPETGEKTCYYVRLSDREMFEDLIKVSNIFLNKFREQSEDRGFDVGKKVGIEMGMERMTFRIYNLPWWRRLFRKF